MCWKIRSFNTQHRQWHSQITCVTVMFLTSPPSCGPACFLLYVRRVWYKVAVAQAPTVNTTGTYSNSSRLQSKGLIHKLTGSQTGFKWTPVGQTDIPAVKLKGKIMTQCFSVSFPWAQKKTCYLALWQCLSCSCWTGFSQMYYFSFYQRVREPVILISLLHVAFSKHQEEVEGVVI